MDDGLEPRTSAARPPAWAPPSPSRTPVARTSARETSCGSRATAEPTGCSRPTTTASRCSCAATPHSSGSSRERLRATLLAWLRRQANITKTAGDLDVHPQTVRYRLARLRERFGAELDSPDVRYELQTVIEAAAGV